MLKAAKTLKIIHRINIHSQAGIFLTHEFFRQHVAKSVCSQLHKKCNIPSVVSVVFIITNTRNVFTSHFYDLVAVSARTKTLAR